MSIPVKAKTAIDNYWTSKESAAAKAVVDLRGILGRDILLEPEWGMVIAELDDKYADKSELVTDVVSVIQVWCKALTELLDEEEGEAWGEELLEKLAEGKGRGLRVNVEVGRKASPSTAWELSRGGFIIYLSNAKCPAGATDFIPLFKSQFLNVFKPEPEPAEDDAEVEAESAPAAGSSATPVVAVSAAGAGIVVKEVKAVPAFNSLPRPDELLSRPPYHLLIHLQAYKITIHCSHSPSLELLEKYLQKWCRQNNSRPNKPPMVTVSLFRGPFGIGVVNDTLNLALEHTYNGAPNLSPAIVLNLVETLLGYRPVYSDMTGFHYRKDTPLKF